MSMVSSYEYGFFDRVCLYVDMGVVVYWGVLSMLVNVGLYTGGSLYVGFSPFTLLYEMSPNIKILFNILSRLPVEVRVFFLKTIGKKNRKQIC
jgi:hypothetical protein